MQKVTSQEAILQWRRSILSNREEWPATRKSKGTSSRRCEMPNIIDFWIWSYCRVPTITRSRDPNHAFRNNCWNLPSCDFIEHITNKEAEEVKMHVSRFWRGCDVSRRNGTSFEISVWQDLENSQSWPYCKLGRWPSLPDIHPLWFDGNAAKSTSNMRPRLIDYRHPTLRWPDTLLLEILSNIVFEWWHLTKRVDVPDIGD